HFDDESRRPSEEGKFDVPVGCPAAEAVALLESFAPLAADPDPVPLRFAAAVGAGALPAVASAGKSAASTPLASFAGTISLSLFFPVTLAGPAGQTSANSSSPFASTTGGFTGFAPLFASFSAPVFAYKSMISAGGLSCREALYSFTPFTS